MTAAGWILLWLSRILRTSSLSLKSLASVVILLAVILFDWGTATLVYVATALLCFFSPGLSVFFPYVLFFGPYPILRERINRWFKPQQAKVLRLTVGTILFLIVVSLYGASLLPRKLVPVVFWNPLFRWPVLAVIGAAGTFVFDWVLDRLEFFFVQELNRYKTF